MRVREVMSRPVVSVRPHLPVRTAAAVLVEHGFTAVPVVDAAGHLCGLVGEAELLRSSIAPGTGQVHAADVAVRAVMSPRPPVVGPDSDLADATELVLGGRARSVPVVEAGRLVGVLTPRDLLRVVAQSPTGPPTDRAGRTTAPEHEPTGQRSDTVERTDDDRRTVHDHGGVRIGTAAPDGRVEDDRGVRVGTARPDGSVVDLSGVRIGTTGPGRG